MLCVTSPLSLFPLPLLLTLNSRTKPGGWTEFKDWDMTLFSSDDSVPHDSYTYKYHQLLYEALDIIKRTYKPGPSLRKWAQEAGYVNITEDILPVPVGLWPKDKKLVCIPLFPFFFSYTKIFLSEVR
jgi:hypothetical protein